MEFERKRLVARIVKARPRLVTFYAPAGFGKTTVAHQYANTFAARATCDCAVVVSEREFTRRLVTAASALAAAPDASDIGEEDIEAALQAWAAHGGDGAIVFENVEALEASPAIRRLFDRALVIAPEGRTLIVCSRKPLRMQTTRIAAPHRILGLRAEDLAFDRGEIATVFGGTKLAKGTLDAIASATRGWPIAVLMLRRLANEERLEASLARLDDVAFEDMHDYLVDEVFASLEPGEVDAVVACAAFTGAAAPAVAAALGVTESEAVDRLRCVSPLATLTDGTYAVHPLVYAAVERRYRTARITFAKAAATAFEMQGRFFDAASLHHRLGDMEEAARLLCAEASVATRKPSPGFNSLLAALDAGTLERYPVLRGLMTYSRRFRVDPHVLREETRAVWNMLRQEDFQLRCNVGNPLARIMYETGRLDEAEALLRELENEAGGIPEVPRNAGEAYIARTLACVLARSGRVTQAAPYFKKGYYTIPGAEFVMSRALIEEAIVERLHGRVTEERRCFERAIGLAFDADATVHIACALAEASFGAWLAGDDERALGFVRRLDERIQRDAMRGFAHYCAVAFGQPDVATNGTEQPNWLACAHLIAAAASAGDARARHCAEAMLAAEASGDRFLRVLATVTRGLSSPAERGERFAEALMHAAAIEAPAPQIAVAALIAERGDMGILSAFVGRFRDETGDASEPVRVEVLTRSIYRGGTAIPLPERERALLVALARQRKPYARRDIAPLLWPDLDEAAAREAFNSCLYRLRQRLPHVVSYSRDGYRLHEGVRVDLRELEHWISSLSARRALLDRERSVYRALYARLRATVAPSDEDEAWTWLAPIFLRADDMRRTVAERLASDALARGEADEALELARQLVVDDPCDETARDLAMRAHIAAGRRGDALREYRQYRDVLRKELDAEPSPALTRLIATASAPSARTAQAS